MAEYEIRCPCCNNKMKVKFDDSGTPAVFLLVENKISQEKLFQKCGIELGLVESEVNV